MANSLKDLQEMRAQLEGIYEHLPRFGLSAARPPILDILDFDGRSTEDNGVSSATALTSGKSSPNGSGDGNITKERDALHHPQPSGGIPGLRVLRENVRQDIEQIDKFLARHAARGVSLNTSTFSTNAPYLIAVWNELTRAPAPIVFIEKTFSVETTGSKPPPKTFSKKANSGAKVDVVADNGRQWIRVNTVKNSRLLAEFRELDSYLTDSESDGDECSEECACPIACGTKPAQDDLDNSLLQMGKNLALAAQNFDPEYIRPRITLRLTRLLLDEDSLSQLESIGLRLIGPRHKSTILDASETDPRIAQTIRELLKLGLDIQLGEHDFKIPPELLSASADLQPRLIPSHRINLDLSVLIALVSDLTHAPLPESVEDAHMRYIPTLAERARSRRRRQQQKELLARAKARKGSVRTNGKKEYGIVASSENSESDGEGESVHSRALASQVIREMEIGLIDEIASRLELSDSDTASPIEFWTSKDARERCLRIIDKIGGPTEKRRASALFFSEETLGNPILGSKYTSADEATDAYWQDSRYPRGLVPGLVPLHIFENEDIDIQQEVRTNMVPHSFWDDLEHSCVRLLSEGATSHPRAISLSTSALVDSSANHTAGSNLLKIENKVDEIERAAVTRGNVRLTAHTVDTLRRGASRRWTTLTANRASVREMLKEIAKEASRANPTKCADEVIETQNGTKAIQAEVAAIWVIEPRSLAEGMRGDFKPDNLI